MCGIFGYIGEGDAVTACCQGLELLEYRGYDSTGIAGISQGKIAFRKKAGKLSELKTVLDLTHLDLAIAHTRWATHGAVNDRNAHPHLDFSESFALVHNGIFENYSALKEKLQQEGTSFSSDTDTEVIVQLIAKQYQGDLLEALDATLPLLEGTFSFLLIHKNHQEIVAMANGCPLTIAVDEEGKEAILSSDPNVFLKKNFHVFFLEIGEMARVRKGHVEIFGKGLVPKCKKSERVQGASQAPSKEGFPHFMLKEIFDQPIACKRALERNFVENLEFQELKISSDILQEIDQIRMIGSGTSSLAGAIGSLLFEDLAQIPSVCEIASEVQYRNISFSSKTLVLAISQSGETADTLAALRKAKRDGYPTIALCNVENSAMAREADGTLFLKAGPEVSVCSTKAFTSQLVMLSLFALYMGRLKKRISSEKMETFTHLLESSTKQMQDVLNQKEDIEKIAKKYARYNNFFFMGRRYMYPTCMEAALKLKEISYVNANGYPAGELKHGPIALLDSEFPCLAFCANEMTKEKIISNLMEVKARGAPLLAIAPSNMKEVQAIADDVIFVPPVIDLFAPFPSIVAGQLLAYFIAKERGCNIDQPRNLAKSVTVE
ncbi:MAG TPA: glutamine--fructose-6-phosphate transaminase (isomerizing) [Chlamydiales bacterium]|nr:glutamine--fructose-6-phosphate transaminase (isomerizing) [Chlamydiales bacterium]